MGILSGVRNYASLINWPITFYKIIIYILLGLGIGIVSYREGKNDCLQEASEHKITLLETQIKEEREIVIRELDKKEKALQQRLIEIQKTSAVAAQLHADLGVIRSKLNEAINNRPGNAVCAPTDDELQQYDEIAKRTKFGNSRSK